jgi:hypothetical protein
MQENHVEQLKERCLFLEQENHLYKETLSQTKEDLRMTKTLYKQLQADFENAIYHLQATRKSG